MHPIKIWVGFTGYPSNHFSGCRLNGRIMTHSKWICIKVWGSWLWKITFLATLTARIKGTKNIVRTLLEKIWCRDFFFSFKVSYKASQIFCFIHACLQNNTFEEPHTRLWMTKGHLKPKAGWRARRAIDSPKKRMNGVWLYYVTTLHGKKRRAVHSFFGRAYGAPTCFTVLSHF